MESRKSTRAFERAILVEVLSRQEYEVHKNVSVSCFGAYPSTPAPLPPPPSNLQTLNLRNTRSTCSSLLQTRYISTKSKSNQHQPKRTEKQEKRRCCCCCCCAIISVGDLAQASLLKQREPRTQLNKIPTMRNKWYERCPRCSAPAEAGADSSTQMTSTRNQITQRLRLRKAKAHTYELYLTLSANESFQQGTQPHREVSVLWPQGVTHLCDAQLDTNKKTSRGGSQTPPAAPLHRTQATRPLLRRSHVARKCSTTMQFSPQV